MGGRLPEEYFVNLIRGWISEDLASAWIKQNTRGLGVKMTSSAHDADRKISFKSSRKGSGRVISGEPDFLIEFRQKRKKKSLEVQRVDRGRLKETNGIGERLVNIPGHRPEVEKEALRSGKSFVIFLFNEGTERIPPEIAILINPKRNGKLKKKEGDLFVWAKFVPARSVAAKKLLMKTFL